MVVEIVIAMGSRSSMREAYTRVPGAVHARGGKVRRFKKTIVMPAPRSAQNAARG
jgi:hypothetical protein